MSQNRDSGKGMGMFLNVDPEVQTSEIKRRATELVLVSEIRPGDTVIDRNSVGALMYRVVATSEADKLNPGCWSLRFDRARDVAGPGMVFFPTFLADGVTQRDTAMVERVTDLGTDEMCTVMKLKEIDKLSADGRVVWQVARQVDSQSRLMVRFASQDEWDRFPLLAVVLVRGRRAPRN